MNKRIHSFLYEYLSTEIWLLIEYLANNGKMKKMKKKLRDIVHKQNNFNATLK